jgi:acyl carrier protein
MDEQTTREKLRQFIVSELIRDDTYPLTNEEGLITGGLIDSFALAQIGVFIEQAFSIYIPDPDLTIAKMDTLDQIVARVMHDVS